MWESLSTWPKMSQSPQLTNVINAINNCINQLANVLSTSFDQVSWFASTVSYWIQNWWDLVDSVIRNLLLLERHMHDLYSYISQSIDEFNAENLVPMLYDIEENLTKRIQSNNFFMNTFWWLVQWLLRFIQVIRLSFVVN